MFFSVEGAYKLHELKFKKYQGKLCRRVSSIISLDVDKKVD